ncbi:hypothetical protein BGX34_001452 [Mortierella sp. NVP85]|nr:hypothetical protein BGX34_001452 [Mortierella sp. NVP85]
MVTLIPSEDSPFKGYLDGRDLKKFSAIGFFDFQRYSSRQRHFASKNWLGIVDLVEEEFPKRGTELRQQWNTTKSERHQYWQEKKRDEEKVSITDLQFGHMPTIRPEADLPLYTMFMSGNASREYDEPCEAADQERSKNSGPRKNSGFEENSFPLKRKQEEGV